MGESESTKLILNSFEKNGSVRAVTKETGYSWNRVVKTLSSEGYVLNEYHGRILELYEQGKTTQQIATAIGISIKTVQSYLPRVRPVYRENQSINAKRIMKCREKKKKKKDE